MLDLKPRLHERKVRDLLAFSVGFPTPARLDSVCRCYSSEPNRRFLGYETDGALVGCIGIEIVENGQAIVHHISVLPSARGLGVGRAMLDHICAEFALQRLQAETDPGAVDFYRKCGFEVVSLGEKYPGVERFKCELKRVQ